MKRYDGRKLKSIAPFDKMFPYLVDRRCDAQIFFKQIICTDPIDAYIRQKRQDNIRISYLHVFVTAYLRVIAQRPKLNRFVMNCQMYARSGISVSMVVKHALEDTSSETTIKFMFTGHENVFDVIDLINSRISEVKNTPDKDDSDKLVSRIMSMPGFTKKALVSFIKSLDMHNLLPRSILDVSPFHATLFISYLKSIKTGYVYHHPFNIGNAGLFVALGKDEKMAIVEDDAVVIRNCCEIGYTIDDRICDGLYLSKSFELVKKYLNNPILLETRLENIVEDVL